jgi:hypothetical protein
MHPVCAYGVLGHERRRNAVARSYGLAFAFSVDDRELHSSVGIDLVALNGDDSWRLPTSAAFAADANGIIRFASGEGYGAVDARPSRDARACVGFSYPAVVTRRCLAPGTRQQHPALTAEQPQHNRRARDTCFGRATCTTK